MDPITALSIGSSIYSSIGGIIGNNKKRRAKNREAIEAFKQREKVRQRNHYQQLTIWNAKKVKYSQDVDEGNLAAARGYSKAQDSLNKSFASAIQANESAFIKYLQNSGKLSAAGRTGRSVNRINTLDIAELERVAGRQAWAVTRSQEAFTENVEEIRRAAVANQNNLYPEVAFSPITSSATPKPVLQKASPLLDLLNVGVSAISAYKQFKSPQSFDIGGRSNLGKGLEEFDPYNSMYPTTNFFNQ